MKAVPVMTSIMRLRVRRAGPSGSLLAAVLLLGACTANPPAPVENRTRAPATRPPVAAVVPSAPIVPSASAPSVSESSSAVPESAERGAAQTAPVRSSGVEVRPLGAPVTGSAASPGTGAPAPAPVPSVTIKREPLGRKRPYSEAQLADLKAADALARAEAANRADAPPRTESGATVPPATGAPVASTQPPPVAAAPSVRADAPGEFAWPAKGKVIQGFGEARSTGIAIAAAPGDPVSAAADGKVIFSGQGPRGYGNLIIVKHDADTLSVYAHGRTLLVKEGQTVRKGQKIAEAGDSGADKPKLLFEIRKGGKPVDPLKLLPSK